MPPDKKPAPSIYGDNHLQEVLFLMIGLIILGGVVGRVTYLFTNTGDGYSLGFLRYIWDYLVWFWPIWKVIALIMVACGLVWGVVSFLRLQEVESDEEKIFGSHHDEAFAEDSGEIKEKENEKWLRVVQHANSNNPSDWRLAIIEADVMLDELLRNLGYVGDGVGEMLKGVDPTDMLTLNNAWDAHKVRNRIAHDGGNFELSDRETRRVIGLFESVFKEFQVI